MTVKVFTVVLSRSCRTGPCVPGVTVNLLTAVLVVGHAELDHVCQV